MTDQHLQLSGELPGQMVIAATTDELFAKLAEAVVAAAKQAIDERGAFHLALSGGGTPKPFYELIATDPRYRTIWPKTHLWIVDDRRVPEDDDRNNFKMIRSAIVDHAPLPADYVHPMPVMADDPASEYERELQGVFDGDATPRLDFVLLGMGDDAHTASLFPGSSGLSVTDRLIANNDVSPGTQPNIPRVTMTYPLLNAARDVAVLVVSDKKAVPLRRVAQQLADGRSDPQTLPITGISPTNGQLWWYLDAAAAGTT